MPPFDVIMVGDVNVDIVLGGLHALPALGTEELAQELDFRGGGSVCNCACAAANLGLRVAMCGVVGADAFGDYMLSYLRRHEVDTSNVLRIEGMKTGATVSLSLKSDRALATYLGSIGVLSASHLDTSNFRNARHLHTGSYFLLRGMAGGWRWLLEEARKAGLTTSMDLGWDPAQKWNGELRGALDLVDVLLPNEEEALHLTGANSPEDALERLASPQRTVVVKRGPLGSAARLGDQVAGEPSFEITVKDTTALGDCFNAGFILAWLEQRPLKQCLRYGNAAAAVAASRLGDERFATRDEVEALLAEA
jgi:sugar/nucleoside kinase (ribokinase family)